MILFAIMALINSIMLGKTIQYDPDIPFIFKIFPYLAGVQICVAALGLISGIHFLKLKAWSRGVLESLTWLLLIVIIGFMIYWIVDWASMSYGHGSRGFGIMGVIMGIIITGIYGYSLGIMLKYLRSPMVRDAIKGGDTSIDGCGE